MDNQHTISRYRAELSSVHNLLFLFLLTWTGFLFILSWVSFFFHKYEISEVMVSSYLVLLGVYIIHKETSRWTGVKMSIKPGEFFVYIWWISLLLMLIISFFVERYDVPPPIRAISYEVLVAFLLSEISKSLNAYKKTG